MRIYPDIYLKFKKKAEEIICLNFIKISDIQEKEFKIIWNNVKSWNLRSLRY